jgi:DNA-binding PadR family transcriptional regulator
MVKDFIYAFIRGLNRPIILWLLSVEHRSGYELIKEFRRLTGQKLKPGIVYPFLHQLEKGDFVVSNWIKKGRRKVRYYSLTKRGENLLDGIRNFFNMPIRELITDLLAKESETN